jgi:hypothetical protein
MAFNLCTLPSCQVYPYKILLVYKLDVFFLTDLFLVDFQDKLMMHGWDVDSKMMNDTTTTAYLKLVLECHFNCHCWEDNIFVIVQVPNNLCSLNLVLCIWT